MVRTTHIEELSEAAAAEADRTLLAGLLAWRATGLATGLATLVAGRDQVRHSRLAGMQVAAAVVESAWLARQTRQPQPTRSRVPALADAVTAVGLLATSWFNLEPADRPTWLNWVPWSFAANALTLQGMQIPRSSGPLPPVAILAGEALQGPSTGDSVANVVAMTGFYAGGRGFAALIRSEAVRLEHAREEAIAAGRRLAAEQERAQALRLLHDNALQSLEAVAAGRYRDFGSVAARLRSEADQLAASFPGATQDGPPFPEPALAQLRSVLDVHRQRGLRIDAPGLDSTVLDDLAPVTLQALGGACHELLTNVAKHAQTDAVTVRLSRGPEMITLEVTDDGVGFDPDDAGAASRASQGFGMRQSVRQRIADVGGTVDVHSAIGQGTRVVLRVPS